MSGGAVVGFGEPPPGFVRVRGVELAGFVPPAGECCGYEGFGAACGAPAVQVVLFSVNGGFMRVPLCGVHALPGGE